MRQAPPGPPAEGGPPGRRRAVSLGLAAALTVVGASALSTGLGFWHKEPPAPRALSGAQAHAVEDAARRDQSGTGAAQDLAPLPTHGLGRSAPVHLTISRVGIDTSVMELGLALDGTLQVPPDSRDAPAGWYRGMASPGEVGPAVIVGHLDAPDAPAVFYNLGALRTGDRAVVTRADGSVAAFRVREVGSYPREYFPTAAVYGPSPTSVLRLITCGGSYSQQSGYTHNIIVFADLVGTATAAEPTDSAAPQNPTLPTPRPQTPTEPAQSVPGPPEPQPVPESASAPVLSGQRAEPAPRQVRAPAPPRREAPPPARAPRPAPKKEKPKVVYREEAPAYDPWTWG